MNNNDKIKEIDLGNGLRITKSSDMGVFMHFKSAEGFESGKSIKSGSLEYSWAVGLLNKLDKQA